MWLVVDIFVSTWVLLTYYSYGSKHLGRHIRDALECILCVVTGFISRLGSSNKRPLHSADLAITHFSKLEDYYTLSMSVKQSLSAIYACVNHCITNNQNTRQILADISKIQYSTHCKKSLDAIIIYNPPTKKNNLHLNCSARNKYQKMANKILSIILATFSFC